MGNHILNTRVFKMVTVDYSPDEEGGAYSEAVSNNILIVCAIILAVLCWKFVWPVWVKYQKDSEEEAKIAAEKEKKKQAKKAAAAQAAMKKSPNIKKSPTTKKNK